ncbi:MAG: type IV pilus modification protein PilV [Desulfobulbaceae bacterium]
MNGTPNNQQGFTLVEVLIAMVILAVGMLTLITMQTTGIKGNAQASHITVASGWASDRIEQIFAMDYDHADLRDDESIDNTANNQDGTAGLDDATDATADGKAVSPDGFYTIYWNVADETMMPNTKTIRIIVLRQEQGITKPVVMNYLKAKYM